jgi:uncharacterized membrane protein YhaH (DUF805 family)
MSDCVFLGDAMRRFLSFSGLSILRSVRRLHDRDRHGAWFLLNFLPVVGGMWLLLECGILPGTKGPNKYHAPSAPGAAPKAAPAP